MPVSLDGAYRLSRETTTAVCSRGLMSHIHVFPVMRVMIMAVHTHQRQSGSSLARAMWVPYRLMRSSPLLFSPKKKRCSGAVHLSERNFSPQSSWAESRRRRTTKSSERKGGLPSHKRVHEGIGRRVGREGVRGKGKGGKGRDSVNMLGIHHGRAHSEP